ncbi:transcription factor HHO2 isoform X2 [Dendrobium catenatum]|uniref:transcription factor HHO2 isoform X2 n=1 Tax=Dendrobium catenatum TaxID=906689 RepID=UPI0009F49D3C|nr:transcription factor HHO2 isoform X2 [Dendrobium catenatum]
MGSLMAELGLDLKLFTKKTIGCFLKNEMKLKDFVGLLEEERQKIEAFKRELPLCMILVNDVIDELKLEAEQCQGGDGVIEEEFIPLKARSDEEDKEDQKDVKLEKDNMEKMDWMSSVQLWNDNCSDESVNFKKDSHKQNGDAVSLESKSRSAGIGAFLPLKVILTRNEEKTLSISLPDLPTAISAPTATTSAVASDNRIIGQSAPSTSAGSAYLVLQAQRKARRCWSPELHRRFVMALQQLGGAQVATPKQIRELMMVDGLTNDEVKSHLQKYRLHTRRMPSSTATEANKAVAMVGSLWASQDQSQISQQSVTQFGSPQGPLQLACTAQALSATGGDSCEDDGRSESYSWK